MGGKGYILIPISEFWWVAILLQFKSLETDPQNRTKKLGPLEATSSN